jgi:hypothetical protein
VDVLVGLPTLDNATTVAAVVGAVHDVFTGALARERTVLVNSDGGSTDGTPDIVRSIDDRETLLASHPLRTLHRVVAPFHGLPGKQAAVQRIFAAAELMQARAVAILDPAGTTTTPERVLDLLAPVLADEVDLLAPRHRRHPRDGVLVSQLVRPVVRAVYGAAIDDPLGAEVACTGRFARAVNGDEGWRREALRPGVDLWLRTTALAHGLRVGQVWRPARAAPAPGPRRPTLRHTIEEVTRALLGCLATHETFWRGPVANRTLPSWGVEPPLPAEPAGGDPGALLEEARLGLRELEPLLARTLRPDTCAAVTRVAAGAGEGLDDEAWVAATYEIAAASHHQAFRAEHLAKINVSLYLARAGTFLRRTAGLTDEEVEGRLETLAQRFVEHRPLLVERWSAG